MIQIYRFKHYVNTVEDKAALREWIRRNVPPLNTNVLCLPDGISYSHAVFIAKEQHYTFKQPETTL